MWKVKNVKPFHETLHENRNQIAIPEGCRTAANIPAGQTAFPSIRPAADDNAAAAAAARRSFDRAAAAVGAAKTAESADPYSPIHPG